LGDVIGQVVNQASLLALSTAIVAVRAGEQGCGFIVENAVPLQRAVLEKVIKQLWRTWARKPP